jgi:hypothetical protein
LRDRPWTAAAASALVYVALTVIMWRDVLAQLATAIAHDAGDPVFTATLLYWNATHVPLTEAWWQLPTFYPIRDTLAFSEHLLGLSPVATPLYWITRNPVATYNLTALLTFPLCGVAMYALVWRLTGSAIAAFVAGLSYAFAPYRAAQLPHVQMLAAFWAPLALLGLHAYVDTGRRRWLALFASAWLLQVATSGYALVFLSLLIGLWVLWFIAARRLWRGLAAIASAAAAAAVPLVPVVYTYLTVHARHGFERTVDEMRVFSADIAAVLCASPTLTFWGWLRMHCRAESDIFPGVGVLTLAIAGLALVLARGGDGGEGAAGRGSGRRAGVVRVLERGFLIVAALYGMVSISVVVTGGWRIDAGPLQLSATSLVKPFVIFLGALVGALFASPGVRQAVRRTSALGFYLIAAVLTWLLALGPSITFMGRGLNVAGPFAALASLPGAEGIRVPARFWLMTVLCLSVVAGLVTVRILALRPRYVARAVVGLASVVIVFDGWARVPVERAPELFPGAAQLRGKVVLEAPPGTTARDAAAQFRAVVGHWTTINGYSGYTPSHYSALTDGIAFQDPAVFSVFRDAADLYVITQDDDSLGDFVSRQPGAARVAGMPIEAFRLPQQPPPPAAHASGERLQIAAVRSRCSIEPPAHLTDGDEQSRWRCEPDGDDHHLLVDLGHVVVPAALVLRLGPYHWEYPRHLLIETSEDGAAWSEAWSASALEPVLRGALANPRALSFTLALQGRPARYVRFRHTGRGGSHGWSLTELEVWGR